MKQTIVHKTLYENLLFSSIYSGHMRKIIEHSVVFVFRAHRHELNMAHRGSAKAALARQISMYLAHVACGLSLSEVGKIFGRDRTTVAHGCLAIEDLREDPVVDRTLQIIEAVLTQMSRSACRGHA